MFGMVISYLPIFVFIFGCILFLPAWKSEKVLTFGKICICVGMSISVWMFAKIAIHIP